MSDNVNRLLVVDDEPGIVEFIAAAAHRFAYTVASAGTAGTWNGPVAERLTGSIVPTLG